MLGCGTNGRRVIITSRVFSLEKGLEFRSEVASSGPGDAVRA